MAQSLQKLLFRPKNRHFWRIFATPKCIFFIFFRLLLWELPLYLLTLSLTTLDQISGYQYYFSVCYIIFLQNIGHGQHVERKIFLKKLHLGVAKILQKWRFFGLKSSFCKLWAIFATPKSASNSKKISEVLF